MSVIETFPSQIARSYQLTKSERLMLTRLSQTITELNPSLVSVDFFHTVLLRGTEPARVRHVGAANRAALALAAQGHKADAQAIVGARLLATRAAMSLTTVLAGPEDVPIQKIMDLTTVALGLPQTAVQTLIDAEMNEERSRLRPNHELLKLLASHRQKSRRIVITSDTNLSGEMIKALVKTFVPDPPFDAIYTSADVGLTKQSGNLLPEVLRREATAKEGSLHIGDDFHADVAMPGRHGIATYHIQHPRLPGLILRGRRFWSKARYGAR